MLNLRYHLPPAAKIKAGYSEEGRYIRIESRGSAIVLLMTPEQSATLKQELPDHEQS